MQPDRSLTPTSYIVLGLVEQCGCATPYELKRLVADSIGNFWSIPHSQLYSEPERLTESGHLTREQEGGGLRRKHYALTPLGRAAIASWRSEPSLALPELRDESLLKLFFGADPGLLARTQRDAHRAKLAEYEGQNVHEGGNDERGPRLALKAGIAHEREWVRFWEGLAGGEG